MDKDIFFGKRFSGYRRGTLSGLDILVLSIIQNNQGISGYDIIQKINQKFTDLWSASAGTIYPLLKKLLDKKFVNIEEIIEKNRHKKIYRITIQGIKALKTTLESNLQPSMSTLGDFIKTVIKAVSFEDKIKEHFCSYQFPFQDFVMDEEVNEKDYSIKNIDRIKSTMGRLSRSKRLAQERMNKIEKKIHDLKNVLNNLQKEREKNAKTIDIIDDDEEFENF